MHNNYYFLRQLSAALEKKLDGTVISECFSQEKDELIIRFETRGDPFFIKASVLPSFSSLSFPTDFQRARKNSVNLFGKLIGQRVTGITQYKNERSFSIDLSDRCSLLFKMHGNRANLVLFENNVPVEVFRNNIPADRKILLDTLDREIDWSFDTFARSQHDLPGLYFTFGKVVWQYLTASGFDTQTVDEKWTSIRAVVETLEHASRYFIIQPEKKPFLSLLRFGVVQKELNEPIAASNELYYSFTQLHAFQQQKQAALSGLRARLQSGKNYLQKAQEKLREVLEDSNYKIWADLIMANLHTIQPNMAQITVDNFYNENLPVQIKLKKDLSPQKNAELLYKKSKNQQQEVTRLRTAIQLKEKDITEIELQLRQLEETDTLKSVKILAALQAETSVGSKKEQAPLPYHEFMVRGWRIWVGKNAQSNDILTLKLGHKEDLWLHAKDVTGSHVLIKHQSGQNFPKDVIARAAELAAYNSKRKNESLCPVIVTPRKYVRKRKGDPAGAVVVEREEVVMVEPKWDPLESTCRHASLSIL